MWQWFFLLVIHFWHCFCIFLLYPSKIQERLLYSFSYTRPFSEGLVIHFCYTWIFIEIFVIPRFVIQLFMHNQKKAIMNKVEQKCLLFAIKHLLLERLNSTGD